MFIVSLSRLVCYESSHKFDSTLSVTETLHYFKVLMGPQRLTNYHSGV